MSSHAVRELYGGEYSGAEDMRLKDPTGGDPDPAISRSLDALNFWLADVRGALGPYLNVFLVTQMHWSQTSVGWVTTASGLLGLVGQTPVGAAIDSTRAKRGLVVGSLAVLAGSAVAIYAAPYFWPVLFANTLIALVGDVFGPAVSAITLGLFARAALAGRLGRNAAFDHAGNVAIAAAAGVVGWMLSQRAVFLLVPVCAVAAAVSVLSIPGGAIDHDRARGAVAGQDGGGPEGFRALLGNRGLLVFAVCALLFHFANAPLLPLVGQKLAASHPHWATSMMSACIIAAQMIMLPIALLVGRYADRVGRKPILLVGFAVLPVRALLYCWSDNAAWLIGVQLLDGVGAGIFGAVTPLLIADLTRGSGRFNVAQAAVATFQGVGASVSGLVVGEIVDRFGYSAAFLESGTAAAVAFVALLLALPETKNMSEEKHVLF
jgi:MFS family permease